MTTTRTGTSAAAVAQCLKRAKINTTQRGREGVIVANAGRTGEVWLTIDMELRSQRQVAIDEVTTALESAGYQVIASTLNNEPSESDRSPVWSAKVLGRVSA
jgi:hypothetical protein